MSDEWCQAEKCPYCEGLGVSSAVTAVTPDGSQRPIRCLDCHGEGKRCAFSLQPLSECNREHRRAEDVVRYNPRKPQ